MLDKIHFVKGGNRYSYCTFCAHSTRSVSTSAAADTGVLIPEILAAADWSGNSIFEWFYYRPQSSSKFGVTHSSVLFSFLCNSPPHLPFSIGIVGTAQIKELEVRGSDRYIGLSRGIDYVVTITVHIVSVHYYCKCYKLDTIHQIKEIAKLIYSTSYPSYNYN